MTSTPPPVPAGWYPAPQEPGFQRYWDGTFWGDERRPAAPQVYTPGPPAERGSVGALICGILGVLVSLLVVPAAIILGIVAVVLSRRTGPKTGISKAGFILGWIAIGVGVGAAILYGVLAAASSMN